MGNLLYIYLGNLDLPLLALDTTNEACWLAGLCGWLAGWLAGLHTRKGEGPSSSNLDTVSLTFEQQQTSSCIESIMEPFTRRYYLGIIGTPGLVNL